MVKAILNEYFTEFLWLDMIEATFLIIIMSALFLTVLKLLRIYVENLPQLKKSYSGDFYIPYTCDGPRGRMVTDLVINIPKEFRVKVGEDGVPILNDVNRLKRWVAKNIEQKLKQLEIKIGDIKPVENLRAAFTLENPNSFDDMIDEHLRQAVEEKNMEVVG